jgi:pimeloyl-ACP methyl ester carboxylesterase
MNDGHNTTREESVDANRFNSSDGLSLAWYEAGHGAELPPIIMQHGFSSSFYWEWVECGLAEAVAGLGRRVIGIDARGHGQSDKPHETRYYGENHMARDVMDLATHLGLASYDLVGYSMGGAIATVVASLDQRARRVVISGVGEAVVRSGGVDRRVLDTKALAAGLRADTTAGQPEIVQRFREGAIARGNDLLALAAHSDAVTDRHIDFAAITAKVLVMAGDTDPLAPHPEVLANAIAGAHLQLVPGDHHFSRRSPEYRAALLQFLA